LNAEETLASRKNACQRVASWGTMGYTRGIRKFRTSTECLAIIKVTFSMGFNRFFSTLGSALRDFSDDGRAQDYYFPAKETPQQTNKPTQTRSTAQHLLSQLNGVKKDCSHLHKRFNRSWSKWLQRITQLLIEHPVLLKSSILMITLSKIALLASAQETLCRATDYPTLLNTGTVNNIGDLTVGWQGITFLDRPNNKVAGLFSVAYQGFANRSAATDESPTWLGYLFRALEKEFNKGNISLDTATPILPVPAQRPEVLYGAACPGGQYGSFFLYQAAPSIYSWKLWDFLANLLIDPDRGQPAGLLCCRPIPTPTESAFWKILPYVLTSILSLTTGIALTMIVTCALTYCTNRLRSDKKKHANTPTEETTFLPDDDENSAVAHYGAL
jgi:hypothetical protein